MLSLSPRSFSPLLLFLGCLACSWAEAASSVADAAQRTQAATSTLAQDLSLDERGLEEENRFAPESDGDADLGQQVILKEAHKAQPFRFNADAYLFWTDNASQVRRGAEEDTFGGWRVEALWQPQITGNLYGGVGVSQDWFLYDKQENLDFETFETTAGLYYVVPELANSILMLQYQYQRLTHHSDPLVDTHSIRFGIQKTLQLDRRNSLIFGLLADWDVQTDVDDFKRNEYSADVAWRFKLMPDLSFVLDYRYTCFDYQLKRLVFDRGRVDNLHTLALTLLYSPRPWLEIYGGCTFSFNRSNFTYYDYDATNAGGGFGARIKF